MWPLILNTFPVNRVGNQRAARLGNYALLSNDAPACGAQRKDVWWTCIRNYWMAWICYWIQEPRQWELHHFPKRERGCNLPIAAPPRMDICVSNRLSLNFLLLTFKAREGLLLNDLYKLWDSPCLQGLWGNEALDIGV